MKQTTKRINKLLAAAFILSHVASICAIVLNYIAYNALNSSSRFMWLPPILSAIFAFLYTWRNTSPRAAKVIAILSALYILIVAGSVACLALIASFFFVVFFVDFLICPEAINMFFFLTWLDIPRDSVLYSIVSAVIYPAIFVPPVILLVWNILKYRKLSRRDSTSNS